MTPVEYCDAYGYARTSVMRWLGRGLVPGAVKGRLVWDIPEDARPHYQPRKKTGRTQRDNMFDFVRALDRRLYVDAHILRCSDEDYEDLLRMLLKEGVICESAHPADGRWHTGYTLTLKGHEYAALSKGEFISTVVRPILAGVAEGLAEAAKG